MNQTSAAASGGKTRKTLMQMGVGAISGAAVTFAVLTLIGKSGFDGDDPSRVVALITGLVFALTGLAVGLGVLAPRPGAHLLNVEDADELREQRGPLWRGALAMLLLGAVMLALALVRVDGSAGVIGVEAAAVIAAISFAAVAVLSFAGRNDHDELMRSISREAMTLAMYGATILLGVWAAAAHLGYATWITPLGTISALLLLQLGAIIIVSARRGLMRQR